MDISAASISRSIANLQSQLLGSLFGSNSTTGNGDIFSALLSQKIGLNNLGDIASVDNPLVNNSLLNMPGGVANSVNMFGAGANSPSNLGADLAAVLNPSTNVKGLSPTGRNLALFDPESAYNMMSAINNRDVLYKAQYSELSQMKSGVAQMQAAGESLGNITAASAAGDIQAQLQHFVEQYNNWRQSFEPDMQQGGLLAGTQAAQVSLYELEQSVKNIFNGAADGIHGLGDLGITIDPGTHLAALDSQKLNATLSTNLQAAVNAMHEFSANFAKSAGLLNADNNFIPNQLDNLSRAIHYIGDNIGALTQEFGTGDAAKPAGKVAQALAAYNQNYA
jgi:hypothetical protein